MVLTLGIGVAATLFGFVSSASFPPIPEGVTTINSELFPGVSISYKQTEICETTPGVKSYSGYVNIPPNPAEDRDFDTHTFFWFFESREDPENSPLSIWVQGGPGVPSITAALGENGPCAVAEDSRNTRLNPWSWNNKVNMLYIDQPVQVGFSYDSLANGTINEIESPFLVDVEDFTRSGLPETNSTYLTGTFSSQTPSGALNTTSKAAAVIWHFMQTWAQEFPEYKPRDNRFSIWSESYGGHYAPTFADYFETRNDWIESGNLSVPAIELHLETVGIINGCIDIETQMPMYPEFAVNNTYGIRAFNETQYKEAIDSFPQCRNLSRTCRQLGDELDPQGWGNNTQVNNACAGAMQYCFETMHDTYSNSGRNQFDIVAPLISAFPPKYAAGYLNTREVQLALGVPLNFTGNSAVVYESFTATGDFVRGHNLDILGELLDRGIKVALVYGDRDFQCNWLGGEKISLAIESQAAADFGNAGYTNIVTNDSHTGGVVRQYGNLSFSRVFDAGHEVPYYEPQTAYEIFNRVMFNKDVATGKVSTDTQDLYSTTGSADSFSIKNSMPAPPAQVCYLWDILETCTSVQKQILLNDSAIVQDFILIGYRLADGSTIFYGNGTTSNGTAPSPSGPSGGGATIVPSAASSHWQHSLFWAMLLPSAVLLGLLC